MVGWHNVRVYSQSFNSFFWSSTHYCCKFVIMSCHQILEVLCRFHCFLFIFISFDRKRNLSMRKKREQRACTESPPPPKKKIKKFVCVCSGFVYFFQNLIELDVQVLLFLIWGFICSKVSHIFSVQHFSWTTLWDTGMLIINETEEVSPECKIVILP